MNPESNSDSIPHGRDRLVGVTIGGRYLIKGCIGLGAMGAVYRAQQTGLDRDVALKILKKDLTWGQDTVARFHREAKAMSALTHPNTVRVFDFGATDDGLLYLAMELLEGEVATEPLQRYGALAIDEAVKLAQQVLQSLAEAHAKGIVHRDIKPDNVFLAHVDGRDDRIAKVLDFGIAKAIEGERRIDQFETLDGTVFGTPRYMSPEQAQGRALDARTDIYSVGILLYELLAGRPPFVDDDAVVVMAKHIRDEPEPFRQAAPDRRVPASLERVVLRALAKVPDDRYQTADDFAEALERVKVDVQRAEASHDRFHAPMWIYRFLRAWSQHVRYRGAALAVLGLFLGAVVLTRWVGHTDSSPVTGPEVPATASEVPATAPSVPSPRAQAAWEGPDEAGEADEDGTTLVMLDSEPSGAAVWQEDQPLGMTPLALVVSTEVTMHIQLRKEGYEATAVEVDAREQERLVQLQPRRRKSKHRGPPRQNRESTRRAPPTSPSNDSPYDRFE